MSDIDYHKLQQKLFEMDPTDPAEDIARLKGAAGGSDAPAPVNQVNESAPAPSEPMDEVAQLAALGGVEKKRTAPITDEASQMAALAGIPVNEGKKDQVRGHEAVKSTSKPSKSGEQDHPFKDRLVGDSQIPRENSDEEVEEGPKGAIDKFKQGKKDYNNMGAFKGAKKDAAKGKAKPQQKKAPESQLPAGIQKALTPYADALGTVFRKPALKKRFEELMQDASKSYRAEDLEDTSTPVTESRKTANTSDVGSIKSELMRRLNNR